MQRNNQTGQSLVLGVLTMHCLRNTCHWLLVPRESLHTGSGDPEQTGAVTPNYRVSLEAQVGC